PCALARLRSSQRRGGARSDGKSPRVRFGRLAAGVVELRRKDFYSNSYGASVPQAIILFIAYHTAVPHHAIHGPCDEVRAVLPTVGGCRPCPHYPCEGDRMTIDPSMLVSGRLQHVGLTTSMNLLSEGTGT
ncbi:hypothetical protein BHE74_00059598, partial [Ensete ventricosum]